MSTNVEKESGINHSISGVTIAPMKLSLPVLQALEEFLENPSERYTLHRRSDQRQVAVSEAVRSQILLSGVTLEQACGRVRQDYWYLPDLEEFIRNSQQQLEPDNPDSSIIYSFRLHDTTGNNWRQFTNEYRLIQCPLTHEIYEMGLGFDVMTIDDPR